jgi:hypothetical protein
MATKEEEFKQRLSGVVLDLTTSEDREAMWLLGSLADRIATAAGSRSWSDFKANLSLEAYRSLLTTFQTQGNALAQKGERQQVYAIEILGVSIIAKTQMTDPDVATEAPALDRIIDAAMATYRGGQTAADPVIR